MKNALLLVIFFALGLQCVAGNATELITKIEKRTLIMVLETTIKTKYDKLDADGQAAYTKAVDNYNRKLREVAGVFWTLNSSIAFKTWDEVNALIKSGEENYLLLYVGNYSVDPKYTQMMQRGLKFYPEIFADNDKREYNGFYTSYKLCFIEDFKKDKYIVARSIQNIWPLKEDIVFAMQYIQCMLTETKRTDTAMDVQKVANNYNSILSTTKLLLKQDIAANGIDKASIKKIYAYEGDVVNRDTLLAYIMARKNVVYIEVVPVLVGTGESTRLSYEHVLTNAQSGMIIGYLPTDFRVLHATMGHGTFHKYVSAGALEKYVSGYSRKDNFYSGEQRE